MESNAIWEGVLREIEEAVVAADCERVDELVADAVLWLDEQALRRVEFCECVATLEMQRAEALMRAKMFDAAAFVLIDVVADLERALGWAESEACVRQLEWMRRKIEQLGFADYLEEPAEEEDGDSEDSDGEPVLRRAEHGYFGDEWRLYARAVEEKFEQSEIDYVGAELLAIRALKALVARGEADRDGFENRILVLLRLAEVYVVRGSSEAAREVLAGTFGELMGDQPQGDVEVQFDELAFERLRKLYVRLGAFSEVAHVDFGRRIKERGDWLRELLDGDQGMIA